MIDIMKVKADFEDEGWSVELDGYKWAKRWLIASMEVTHPKQPNVIYLVQRVGNFQNMLSYSTYFIHSGKVIQETSRSRSVNTLLNKIGRP